MITKGCTSAYATWVKINEESGGDAYSYKNIGKRFVRLAKHGLLEEIKLEGVENLHGRKDYKLTTKGLERLLPYLIEHPEEIQTVIAYIEKFALNKNVFGILLLEKHTHMTKLLNAYQNHTSILFDPGYWSELGIKSHALGVESDRINNTIQDFNSEFETLILNINDSSWAPNILDKFDKYKETVTKERKHKSSKEEDAEDKEFLHEMKLSMMPSNTSKKITKRSNVNELEMARNIAEIEATITEYYENIRFLLQHHGIEVILESDKNKNRIILKRSVPQKDENLMRPANEVKSMMKSADQGIERMKKAFPLTTETIKKLEEIIYRINKFSLEKSVEFMEGISTITKKQ